jgi:DNA-binding NarL/FixJ family response regulator
LKGSIVRVLVVDDYEPWRSFVRLTLQVQAKLQVIGEASDGLEAVQLARQLQPDLILLDLGLPTVNGIEVARGIRELSPNSKILFLSENRSRDIAAGALQTGALGYVVKSDAVRELLPAVEAVLQGRRFVSTSLDGDDFTERTGVQTDNHPARNKVVAFTRLPNVGTGRHHEAGFYSDDRRLLDHLTQFAGAALKSGNATIVAATESHRDALLSRLQAYGLDIGAAIEQGRYVALDAADALAAFMRNRMPDPVLFVKTFDQLILAAAKAATADHPQVAIFGECAHLLWAQGNGEAAIQMEKLGNQLTKAYDVDILCGYLPRSIPGGMDRHIFQRVCAEHSAVHSR